MRSRAAELLVESRDSLEAFQIPKAPGSKRQGLKLRRRNGDSPIRSYPLSEKGKTAKCHPGLRARYPGLKIGTFVLMSGFTFRNAAAHQAAVRLALNSLSSTASTTKPHNVNHRRSSGVMLRPKAERNLFSNSSRVMRSSARCKFMKKVDADPASLVVTVCGMNLRRKPSRSLIVRAARLTLLRLSRSLRLRAPVLRGDCAGGLQACRCWQWAAFCQGHAH